MRPCLLCCPAQRGLHQIKLKGEYNATCCCLWLWLWLCCCCSRCSWQRSRRSRSKPFALPCLSPSIKCATAARRPAAVSLSPPASVRGEDYNRPLAKNASFADRSTFCRWPLRFRRTGGFVTIKPMCSDGTTQPPLSLGCTTQLPYLPCYVRGARQSLKQRPTTNNKTTSERREARERKKRKKGVP